MFPFSLSGFDPYEGFPVRKKVSQVLIDMHACYSKAKPDGIMTYCILIHVCPACMHAWYASTCSFEKQNGTHTHMPEDEAMEI